jgi:hypothetical protein
VDLGFRGLLAFFSAVPFFLAVFLGLIDFFFIGNIQIEKSAKNLHFNQSGIKRPLHFYGHEDNHMISKKFMHAPVAQLDRATDF